MISSTELRSRFSKCSEIVNRVCTILYCCGISESSLCLVLFKDISLWTEDSILCIVITIKFNVVLFNPSILNRGNGDDYVRLERCAQ